MAMLLRPDAGGVVIGGQVVRGWGLNVPPQVRRSVQLIWQSPRASTDLRYTLRQIISEPLQSLTRPERLRARERLRELIERAGLTDELLGRHPHAVSDGQLQRACLIRALLVEPRYLICDEFSAMLDASTQAALLHVIAEEQARTGLGVVLITHDHRLAVHWCERVMELREGKVSERV